MLNLQNKRYVNLTNIKGINYGMMVAYEDIYGIIHFSQIKVNYYSNLSYLID